MDCEMAAMPMGAVARQPKMAEGATLFRPTLAEGGVSNPVTNNIAGLNVVGFSG